MAVILETSLGNMTVDLFTDERPKCCKNFLKLCKVKYYNFSLFHSVQRNLVAQTGDPTGTGRGGESIFGKLYGDQARYFEWEVTPRIKHKNVGTVSMVNNGDNMHGSQFFITLGENLDYLDGKHTVFGEVSEGIDVLMKINEAYCDEEHRPYKDIRIYHTIILDDPYDDPDGLEIPDRSPEPTEEMKNSTRIGAEEDIDDFQGRTEEEIKEILDDREEKANAQILEMVGDLPDVDVKPPDNVLFVCKLNSVTSDEDLETIFSRFGNILSCEVIKDHKTQESLQYAFIEFEKPEDCEKAYFKMDNVLIDDRRIHVDFSQSVSKVKWKGKGKGVEYAKDKEEKQPQYIIKDKHKRKDDKYDLLFEDEAESKKKKKKKKHKTKDEDSDDSDNNEVKRKKKKKKHREDQYRSRSRSPARDKYRKRSLSRERSDRRRDKGDIYKDYDRHKYDDKYRHRDYDRNYDNKYDYRRDKHRR